MLYICMCRCMHVCMYVCWRKREIWSEDGEAWVCIMTRTRSEIYIYVVHVCVDVCMYVCWRKLVRETMVCLRVCLCKCVHAGERETVGQSMGTAGWMYIMMKTTSVFYIHTV